MEIQVTETYKVALDTQSWAIQKKKGKRWEPFKWCRDLHQAIEIVRNLEMERMDVEGVGAALEGITALNRLLHASMDEFIERYPKALWVDANEVLLIKRKETNERAKNYSQHND